MPIQAYLIEWECCSCSYTWYYVQHTKTFARRVQVINRKDILSRNSKQKLYRKRKYAQHIYLISATRLQVYINLRFIFLWIESNQNRKFYKFYYLFVLSYCECTCTKYTRPIIRFSFYLWIMHFNEHPIPEMIINFFQQEKDTKSWWKILVEST